MESMEEANRAPEKGTPRALPFCSRQRTPCPDMRGCLSSTYGDPLFVLDAGKSHMCTVCQKPAAFVCTKCGIDHYCRSSHAHPISSLHSVYGVAHGCSVPQPEMSEGGMEGAQSQLRQGCGTPRNPKQRKESCRTTLCCLQCRDCNSCMQSMPTSLLLPPRMSSFALEEGMLFMCACMRAFLRCPHACMHVHLHACTYARATC